MSWFNPEKRQFRLIEQTEPNGDTVFIVEEYTIAGKGWKCWYGVYKSTEKEDAVIAYNNYLNYGTPYSTKILA